MLKYPSTQKSGEGSVTEIDAALFDLLAKINQTDSDLQASNIPKIVNSPIYGRYREYPDGSTQGRFIKSSVVRSQAVALTTSVSAEVTSILLPKGKWDISCMAAFVLGATTSATIFIAAINKASATVGPLDAIAVPDSDGVRTRDVMPAIVGVTDFYTSIPSFVVDLAETTRFFLNVSAAFTISTCSGYGTIQAVSIL